MPKQIILPAGTPPPLAPYVPATKADNIVYVSGILAFDENNNVLHVGDAAAQTRHVLETIKGILANAGGSLKDVTFNHIFLRDWADYAAMNQVLRRRYGKAIDESKIPTKRSFFPIPLQTSC